MDLRSGARTGAAGAPAPVLTPAARAGFEEGVGLVFSQWTALVLAVDNGWGGPDSAAKADYFIEDTLEWFAKKKGAARGARPRSAGNSARAAPPAAWGAARTPDAPRRVPPPPAEHFADELELELADTLLEEFHVEAEDGSPAQVAKQLVELHAACCRNDASVLQQLRARQVQAAGAAAASKRQVVDLDGAELDGDSSSGSGSDDGSGNGMDEDMDDAAPAPAAVPIKAPPAPPVVDADGFELVQKRRGRR
ncbi:TSR2 [Scenedesmus sp. PABB004]|nr:TSR2 [Scenedesmus sp. PABB004]